MNWLTRPFTLTYLLQHDLYAVLVRRALLPELPAAEVVKVPDGDHARLRVSHQADVAGQGGVGTCRGYDTESLSQLHQTSIL